MSNTFFSELEWNCWNHKQAMSIVGIINTHEKKFDGSYQCKLDFVPYKFMGCDWSISTTHIKGDDPVYFSFNSKYKGNFLGVVLPINGKVRVGVICDTREFGITTCYTTDKKIDICKFIMAVLHTELTLETPMHGINWDSPMSMRINGKIFTNPILRKIELMSDCLKHEVVHQILRYEQ